MTEIKTEQGSEVLGELKTITMDTVTRLLVHEGLMSEEQRKNVIVKERPQRAVCRNNSGTPPLTEKASSRTKCLLSPVEVLASFELEMPDTEGKLLLEDRIMGVLAKALDMEQIKIDPTRLDMDLVTQTISRGFARRHRMVPIGQEDDTLVMAVDDPFDLEGLDLIQQATKRPNQDGADSSLRHPQDHHRILWVPIVRG